MTDTSSEKGVIEFEIAIIRALYKNEKIGEKEFNHAIKILESRIKKISDEDINGQPIIIDLKI